MPNINAPFGLRPVSDLAGNPYSGSVRLYSIPSSDANAVFIGDLVTAVGTAQIVEGIAYTDVARSATGDVFQGVVVGVSPDTQDSTTYRAASTRRLVFVADDPNALFMVQQVSGGTPLTVSDVGLNANIVVGAGSTVTGYSGTTLNNATEATTNTLDVKIVSVVNAVDNDFGVDASTGADASRFLVRLNRHRFVNQIAGI